MEEVSDEQAIKVSDLLAASSYASNEGAVESLIAAGSAMQEGVKRNLSDAITSLATLDKRVEQKAEEKFWQEQ